MIPISSQADKYKGIIEKKKKRYGKCNTIVIGLFAGKENAFLIQNAFPVIEKYFDHIHTIQEQPVTIHKKLDNARKLGLYCPLVFGRVLRRRMILC